MKIAAIFFGLLTMGLAESAQCQISLKKLKKNFGRGIGFN